MTTDTSEAGLELFHGTPLGRERQGHAVVPPEPLPPSPASSATAGDETRRALDIGLFINGLPVFTFEIKNNLTKQAFDDAIQRYRRDRSPREPLFRLGRCVAHFAVDENEVHFCTHLKGKASWFLPFKPRLEPRGKGNRPPNPDGLKTEYLWREVLARESLTDILENYAHAMIGEIPDRPVDDVRQLLAADAEPLRGFGDSQSQWFQAVVSYR